MWHHLPAGDTLPRGWTGQSWGEDQGRGTAREGPLALQMGQPCPMGKWERGWKMGKGPAPTTPSPFGGRMCPLSSVTARQPLLGADSNCPPL